MTEFYREDTTLTTAKVTREYLWVENSIEYVDAHCALPKYSIPVLPPKHLEGQWPKWKPASKTWHLIPDHRFIPFYDASGKLYLPEEVETPFPDWAIFTKPPEHNSTEEEVIFLNGEWLVYTKHFGKPFFNKEGFVGHAGCYFDLQEDETFDHLPLNWAEDFKPEVRNSKWVFVCEDEVLTSIEMDEKLKRDLEEAEALQEKEDLELKEKELVNENVMRVLRGVAKSHLENQQNLSKEDALTLQLLKALDK